MATPRGVARRAGAGIVVLALSGLLGGCELEEVTLVDPEEVVVAEGNLQIDVPGTGGGSENRLTVFLHRTLGPGGESSPVPGARVAVRRPADGYTVELVATGLERCIATTPVEGTGTCYWSPPAAVVFGPGDAVELRIDLLDGGVLESRTVVPGAFRLQDGWDGDRGPCALPGGEPLPIVWTRSEGAWAYAAETVLRDLTEALAPRGIAVDPEDDPLYLLGLVISASDTTIVFPGEFGLFDRFELDQEISVALQDGLPPPGRADITVAATDRNYVNWVRGGNFNPSGQVRIPSVRGDGTGVFASSVVKGFQVVSVPDDDPGPLPHCPGS